MTDGSTLPGRGGRLPLRHRDGDAGRGNLRAATGLGRWRRRRLPASINKNGVRRDVPLSKRALELLALLPDSGEAPLFGISTASLDALFRKARQRSCIEGLTFHDSRHAAITRLAKKLNVLDLARMVSHRDLRMLQVYYNESAEDMAAKLG